MSSHVTALPLYGGMRLPFAIGAVVEGVEIAFQTPDSGQTSPVRARVPIGLRVIVVVLISEPFILGTSSNKRFVDLEIEAHYVLCAYQSKEVGCLPLVRVAASTAALIFYALHLVMF